MPVQTEIFQLLPAINYGPKGLSVISRRSILREMGPCKSRGSPKGSPVNWIRLFAIKLLIC